MSTTVRQILARKPDVYFVTPQTTVLNALKVMADRNIGAVLVLDGDDIVGIFSERDYARKVVLQGKTSKDVPVREVMTSPVVCAEPGWTAHDCMAMMTQRHIRHLPVVERTQLVGVISIGDIVSAVVAEQASTIKVLEHYIASGS
jgi:CBS domain-containing protein